MIQGNMVVPLAGTWIETKEEYKEHKKSVAFPSRERGLKQIRRCRNAADRRRSPRGNVD